VALTTLLKIRIRSIVEFPFERLPVPIPEPERYVDATLWRECALMVEFETTISQILESPETQSPVPIPDPRCTLEADVFALTVEFEIVR
jgi:hypothetical protein